jgi:GAF domain-containing protein
MGLSDQHASSKGKPSAEDGGTAAPLGELGQQLADLARALQTEPDTEAMLDEIVAGAVAIIPGVDEGSISVVLGRRDVTSHSPSSDLPRRVDAIQTELGEGPCLDAVYREQTVRVPDMANEQRWPEFARRAAEAGASSMLSFQLYVEGDNLGALNLYGRRPNAFTDESEQVGLLLASHAAVAFADAQKVDHLNREVDARDLIGQAKGILMERFGITAHQAFNMLVQVSQDGKRKLHDIARELTESGRLSGPGARLPQNPWLSGRPRRRVG